MKLLIIFDFCSLNWAELLIGSFIGGIIGFAIVEMVDRRRLYRKRKKLAKLQGTFIASAKDDPNSTQAIIRISLMKGSYNIIDFFGTSLVASNYNGTIKIDENPNSGTGQYSHVTQNLARGEFIGFGVITIIIKSPDQIFVMQTFQRNKEDVHNPEVWNRVEGKDIGKSVQELFREYKKKLKDYKDSKFVVT